MQATNVIEANSPPRMRRSASHHRPIQVQLGSGYSINALMSGPEIFASIGWPRRRSTRLAS